MNDCNYFVPIISDAYVERICSPNPAGAVVADWNHAVTRFPEWLTMIGIWHSGSPLREPSDRGEYCGRPRQPVPWGPGIAEMFPEAPTGGRGVPKLPAPCGPPDPPGWPTYRPYET
jgi:hypothetical protein